LFLQNNNRDVRSGVEINDPTADPRQCRSSKSLLLSLQYTECSPRPGNSLTFSPAVTIALAYIISQAFRNLRIHNFELLPPLAIPLIPFNYNYQ
jgi:hypothetical protein